MGHEHSHNGVKNIKSAFFLNVAFTIIEIIGGFYTNSIAIVSDSLHDLGDSLSLGLAWYLQHISGKKGGKTFSFGYKRFSLLGAVINSVVLVSGSVFILFQTIPRIITPQHSDAKGMLLLAIFGVIVNGAAVFKLRKGKSLNERVVMLHFLEDVLGWCAVLIASVVMIFADVPILDPILAIAIVCFVLFNAFRNLMKGGKIFLQAIPKYVNMELIAGEIVKLKGVGSIEDIHVWSMDGEFNILSMHIVPQGISTLKEASDLKVKIRKILDNYNIKHSTIEINPDYAVQPH